MLVLGDLHARGRALGAVCFLAPFALAVSTFPSIAVDAQDFETWPATSIFGTTMDEGWTLSDGQVKGGRGGFGPPLGGTGQCGWLYDFDDSTNSWLQSPAFAPGVLSISFWTRQDTTLPTNSHVVLEQSSNQIDWIAVDAITIDNFDWIQETVSVDSFGNTYVRIRKTGDDGAGTYAGLDDIEVTARPAVFLSDLATSTGVPTLPETLDIFVDALIDPSGSNIVITTYYRNSTNDSFTAILMTLDAGDTYKTVNSIALAGFPNGVEYYIEAVFDEGGASQVYLPPGGSNAPAFYSTYTVSGELTPRQLNPSSDKTPHIISEIMYHPADSAGTNSLEYIELFNTDAVSRDISGYRISGDVDYTFPPGTIMTFRSYLVVARDPNAVQQAYGIENVFGPYSNNLPNAGGRVRLRNDFGGIILEVNYDDELPWPASADGAGHSLQLSRPDYGEGDVRAWHASAFVGGTPGEYEPSTNGPLRKVVINEYLAHTDLPDADYIELYNAGTQAVDISGCGLANTLTINEFFVPSATILQPGDHIIYDQAALGFSLRAGGDEIFLWAPDFSHVVDAVRFKAQVNGVPSGRFPDGASAFHALDTQSPGAANSSAELLIDNVVINEIMFAPLSNKDRDEYVELYNKGTNTVDLSYWRFVDGIDYLFPAGTQIPAGGYLVVAGDLQNLLPKYPQLNMGNTLGNFNGRLSNRGERIALAKPDDPGLPFEDLVIVDEVTYGDGDRWGEWTDGGGSSLELVDAQSNNRLAMNWRGSDESEKSSWITIERTGELDQGTGTQDQTHQFASSLYVFLPQEGECLVDDVEVIRVGDVSNRIVNSGFEFGLAGWTADGTHRLSTNEVTEGFGSPGSLHLRASGAGSIEGWVSHVGRDEVNNAHAPLTTIAHPGEFFTLRAKARWLAGWPHCVLGFDGHWLEAVGELAVPLNLGSPGLQNSSYSNNVGPAIYELTHHPILPAANETVIVTCRAHDSDGLASVTLEYRTDPSIVYTAVQMRDDGTAGDALAGDGVYSAQIPGKSSGVIVPFRVKVQDNHANPETTWFPSMDLKKGALVRFGEPKPLGMLATYIVWVSDTNLLEWTSSNDGGDQLHDMTFVYQNYRAIYNAGIRNRGNGRGGGYNNGAYSCSVPDDERFLGNNELKIDNVPHGLTRSCLEEHHAYWIAREAGVASSHIRLLLARVNGSHLLRQQYQPPSRDFCKSWYGDDDPVVFEDMAYDPFLNYVRSDGLKAKAKYRYGQRRKRTSLPSDSFDTIYSVAHASLTGNFQHYDARMHALVDPYGFGAHVGVRRLVGDGDSYGTGVPRNMFYYLSPTIRSRLHLHDMDGSFKPGFDGLNPIDLTSMLGVLAVLYDRPLFSRAYWRLMKNFAEGPLAPENVVPEVLGWYEVLKAHDVEESYPQNIIDASANRRQVIFDLLPSAPFTLLENNFSTSNNITTLSGTVPLEVTTFRLNGQDLRVTFPTVTNWLASVGLKQGPNAFVVEGQDSDGSIVGSDSVTVTLAAADPSPIDQLLITEIMYHPIAPQAEYVEIFNRSLDTFDLGGWRLNGADIVCDSGALIGPGEYRVLAENVTAYQHAYGNAEVVIGDYGGNLDNGGETLILEMPIGSNAWMEIDKVRYDDAGVWSTNADGSGMSLQLIDLDTDNSRAGSWGVVPAPAWERHTPGAGNSNAMTLFDFPLLWINEVMPSNVSVITDNFTEFDPWIELYNADAVSHDLSGYRLSDDYSELDHWAFPTGTVIASGSRLLVWADGETNQSDVGFLHTDFRLNSTNGSVILTRQWLGSPVVVDYLDYNSVGEDASYGSFPEGDAFSRLVFPVPSPGTANNPMSPSVLVVINEWMSDNETIITDPSDGTSEDWFELYNPSTGDANLNGYTLTDDLSVTNMFTIPPGITVPAGKFLFVWADNEPEQNGPGVGLHVNFRLSRDGDAIGLYAPSGMLVDSVIFGSQEPDQSFGRWPDGAPVTYTMSPPTPAASNSVYVAFMVDVSASTSDVFQVDATTNLLGTNWILFDIFTAENGVVTFTDSNAAAMPERFYRLIED
jgi:hypothetical protein